MAPAGINYRYLCPEPRGTCARSSNEAHIPAKQSPQGTQARFPRAHEHTCRSRRVEVTPRQGPLPPQRLIGRIQSRSAFRRVALEGQRHRSGPLSCTMVLDATLPGPLVGYALGRHVGSAVARNRLRRQLRELVKSHESRLGPGYYVISAGPKAAGQSSSALAGSLAQLMQKCSAGAPA